jgi:predicted N-acetyltransferase YhbS
MALRIRSARPADLPQIYDLLRACFNDAPIELFIEQTEGDSAFRWRHARVAELDGRIVAHVRIFARTMLVRGVPVRAAGIGSVATLPQLEGSGFATALLYDALHHAHALGMPVAYLFTGRATFYERVGFRVVCQPGFLADAREAAAIDHDRAYDIRPIEDGDVPALLRIYRTATARTTGAIVRTANIWRDAQRWLDEDPDGCLVATRAGRAVAYLRARQRHDGRYQVLEAEHLPQHEAAVAALLARAGQRADALRVPITALVPDDHALATALRTLPSTTESEGPSHVEHPMMMRIVSLDALLAALLPGIRDRARTHRGDPFALTMHAPDGEAATLAITGATASIRRRANGAHALDEAATLDALLGQRRTSRLVRPRPPRELARRMDAILPESALHFWNSDRI